MHERRAEDAESSGHLIHRKFGDLWLKVLAAGLTVAFGIWAGIVRYGIDSMLKQLSEIQGEQQTFERQHQAYVLATERRLTGLEDHDNYQDVRREEIRQMLVDHLHDERRGR